MADNFEQAIGQLKEGIIGSNGLGLVGNLITTIIVIIVTCAICGALIWLIFYKLRYKYTVIIFEKINGRYEPTIKDKAARIKFGEAGDELLKLRKAKKILPLPTIQMGRRVYWFAQREDGEYINIGIQDLDEKSRQLDVMFLDKEMRYARTQIQKGLKERYDQQGFWSKYGQTILGITFFLMIGIMTYLLFDKYIDLASQVAGVVQNAAEVQEATKQILVGLDNVCSGSGITKVG